MRVEVVICDLEGCKNQAPNGTSGFTMVHFEGSVYDFCSSDHQQKWEEDLGIITAEREIEEGTSE